jgi:hypothetical protein
MPWTATNVRTLTATYYPWTVDNAARGASSLFPTKNGSIRFQTNGGRLVNSKGDVPSQEKEPDPPPYDPSKSAVDVFSDPFFYSHEEAAEAAREVRQKELKNMTVGDVYRKFIHGHKDGTMAGLLEFASMIWAQGTSARSFFAEAMLTVEEALADKKLIVISGPREVEVFDQRFVKNLPAPNGVWKTGSKGNETGKTSRLLPLCLVLGPSGSGKTFFSLQYLREGQGFLNASKKKQVSVYMHPGSFKGINWENGSLVAKQLINTVKERCAIEIKKEIHGEIGLHFCLIFDEAGSSFPKEWFESRDNLQSLCTEALKFASSATIVVAGTGITGRELNSNKDAYFFRMKEWEETDLAKFLEHDDASLRLMEGETIKDVAHAIFANPKLRALATNARSAYFLVDSIHDFSIGCTRSSWGTQLDEWTPLLVTKVVNRYIGENGLGGLNVSQRRRVAAFIFRALHELKKGDTTLPTFEGLGYSEKPVAESLIQYNLEGKNTKPEIVPTEKFAFTVTPAIALILYSLAGVYATLLPGWKNEEELAALYAVRQLILKRMEKYSSTLSNENCRDQLDKSLGKIRLLRLQTPLQSKSACVSVPMVDDSTIIMNGDRASFADIIAPYQLIQAKRTKESTLKVELYDELEKCGLLKQHCDTRLLRGLLAMWHGSVDVEENGIPVESKVESKAVRNPQLSKAFPESLLSLVPPLDRIRFARIQGKSGRHSNEMIMDDGKRLSLPVLDGTCITFIIATNAEMLNLNLTPSRKKQGRKGKSKLEGSIHSMNRDTRTVCAKLRDKTSGDLIITEADLNDDMEIIVDQLSESAKLSWTSFMENSVGDGVKLKFLFTI